MASGSAHGNGDLLKKWGVRKCLTFPAAWLAITAVAEFL